jgi:hypothetical protein
MKYAEEKILKRELRMTNETNIQIHHRVTQCRQAFELQSINEGERTTFSAKRLHESHEVFLLQNAILQSFSKSQGFHIII